MTNEDGQVAIVVNGEIYNHAELRADLDAKGHRFRSGSDTEVVVHLYEEVGARVPSCCAGCSRSRSGTRAADTLLLARDRFGEKPLYYARAAGRVRVRVRARRPAGRRADAREPVAAGAGRLPGAAVRPQRPTPSTTGDQEAPRRATLLELRCGERPVVRRYYRPQLRADAGRSSASEEAAARVRATVEEAVQERLMSDVPLGAFLSGGIDSSIVVACMARATGAPVQDLLDRVHGGGRADNELPYARLVAERYHTDHHELMVAPDMVGLLPSDRAPPRRAVRRHARRSRPATCAR